MHHKRVVQEKNKLINDLKRSDKHYKALFWILIIDYNSTSSLYNFMKKIISVTCKELNNIRNLPVNFQAKESLLQLRTNITSAENQVWICNEREDADEAGAWSGCRTGGRITEHVEEHWGDEGRIRSSQFR